MVLAYTEKLSDANFFHSSYLSSFKQQSLIPQAMHLFDNTCVYFDEYPKKYKIIHINRKMLDQKFYNIDRFFYKDDKQHKECYVYVVHPVCKNDQPLYFFSLNEQQQPQNMKLAGMINSQLAAINKIVETVNKLKYRD